MSLRIERVITAGGTPPTILRPAPLQPPARAAPANAQLRVCAASNIPDYQSQAAPQLRAGGPTTIPKSVIRNSPEIRALRNFRPPKSAHSIFKIRALPRPPLTTVV
jgi:hypothetical protein